MNKFTEKITQMLKKDKKLLLIVLLGLSGMLLLLFSGNGKADDAPKENASDITAAEKHIEEKLSALLRGDKYSVDVTDAIIPRRPPNPGGKYKSPFLYQLTLTLHRRELAVLDNTYNYGDNIAVVHKCFPLALSVIAFSDLKVLTKRSVGRIPRRADAV